MADDNYKEWILETIDHLRKRKARPDMERICHMVSRRHGASSADISAALDNLVRAEVVIKVDYKGSTSYRNAAKWKKAHQGGGNTLSSVDASRRLYTALKAVSRSGEEEGEVGATREQLEAWLEEHRDPASCLTTANLQATLERDVQAGRVQEVSPGKYLAISPPKTPKSKASKSAASPAASPTEAPASSSSASSSASKPTPPPPAADQPPTKHTKSSSAQSSKHQTASPSKKNRSHSTSTGTTGSTGKPKRKRFKKNLWPGFVDVVKQPRLEKESTPSEENMETSPMPARKMVSAPASMEEMDDKCDYCLQTKECNRKGQPEDLLICKDCQAKAHPSCMEYSEDLAKRARNSPWQCIDCKTCYVCEDSGDPDAMLFCDACDKGYHMNCHNPPVPEKPTGNWVCSQCVLELGLSDEEQMDTEEAPHKPANEDENTDGGGPSCLPTPSDSPLHFPASPQAGTSEDQDQQAAPGPSPASAAPPAPEVEKEEKKKKEKKDTSLTLKIRLKKDKDPEKSKKEPSYHKAKVNGHAHVSTPRVPSLPRLADTLPEEVPDASDWSVDDVVNFFLSVGFVDQAEVFREQEIDGKSLLLMKRNDVLTGLSLKLGPALKIYTHVQRLQTRGQSLH